MGNNGRGKAIKNSLAIAPPDGKWNHRAALILWGKTPRTVGAATSRPKGSGPKAVRWIRPAQGTPPCLPLEGQCHQLKGNPVLFRRGRLRHIVPKGWIFSFNGILSPDGFGAMWASPPTVENLS